MSGIFGVGEDGSDLTRKAPPLQRVVDWFHGRASTNRREDIHHRLGYGPGDAAPGEDFRAMMLGQNVPGFSGTPWDTGPGFRLLQVVTFTSSGTFKKADYPGLKAIRVRLVGGGGAGGGSQAGSGGQHSSGLGGGAGGYAESFITDIAGLPDTVTVTVGAGGAGTTSTGGAGGTSSYGTLVVATGGGGGGTKPSNPYSPYITAPAGGVGTAGSILIRGQAGGVGAGSATLGTGGTGGSSQLGGGGTGAGSGSSQARGGTGGNYGGGGGGSFTTGAVGSAQLGGDGAPGIVIVELYT